MKTYQASLKKLVAFLSALILVSVSSPIACWAAEDDNLPGLKVLRAPQPEPARSSTPVDDGLLKRISPHTDSAKVTDVKTADVVEKANVHAYTLGPGDVLSVTDYGMHGETDFSTQTVTVLPDGTVNIYPVGLMKVSGLSLKQFNDRLNEKAKEFVVEPQYVVNMVRARPISVYVLGEVANPGLYSFGEGGDAGQPNFGGGGVSPLGRALSRGGVVGKIGKPGKLSPDVKTTGEMLGAVYGAKFAQWAPKWGAVGGLAAMGMAGRKSDDGDSALSGLPQQSRPYIAPGSGAPARNLNSLGAGNSSAIGNMGALTYNDLTGGVNSNLPGFGPTGGVGTRGSYPGSSNMMIPAQASVNVSNVTVMNAIERAGGLRETANVRRIQVRRAVGKEVINVDLWKLVNEGDITQDIVMQPNDTIFIPQGGSDFNPDALGGLASFKGRWVRVLGAVRAPGLVELRPNDDVYSVLARAGGFSTFAATRSVVLSRMNRDGTIFSKRISLVRGMKDREALARLPVQSGDVVIASGSMIKSVGQEVLRAGMITGLAMLVIYFSNKVHNVNVQTNDEGQPTNNARVAVF